MDPPDPYIKSFIDTVTSYRAYLYPRGTAGESHAEIILQCDELDAILSLRFRNKLLANTYNPYYRRGVAYLPVEQYLSYMDLLRNEKPIQVKFGTDASFTVFCGKEPPGAEETEEEEEEGACVIQ